MRHRVTIDPRDHYVSAENERDAEDERYSRELKNLDEQFDRELAIECHKAGINVPGSKLLSDYLRVNHPDFYAIFSEPHERRVNALLTQYQERRDVLTTRLCTLAQWSSIHIAAEVANTPPPGPPWIEYYVSRECDYRSQNAQRAYVEASVTTRLWSVGYADPRVPCVIVWDDEVCKLYVALESDLDRRILYFRCYRGGVPIGEFIRRCWARTWNPRVLDPFLPVGLEDRLGIDYQGRNKYAIEYSCARCGRVYEASASEVYTLCECGFDLRPVYGSSDTESTTRIPLLRSQTQPDPARPSQPRLDPAGPSQTQPDPARPD